jgi:FtsH-binding integral membrane protein
MRLSWIGKSAIIIAGAIVLALIGIQVFNPAFFTKINEYDMDTFHNVPLLAIASIASIVFLKNTRKMDSTQRAPWEFYSWFVLGFSSIVAIVITVKLIFWAIGKSSDGFEMFMVIPIFLIIMFIFVGLGYERNIPTGKNVKDITWVFIAIAVMLFVLIGYTPLDKIPHFQRIVTITLIFLIPVSMCIQTIRKNDRHLRNIYILVLLSQIVAYLVLIVNNITGMAMLESLVFKIVLLSFAIAFDLRLSLFLSEQNEKSIEPANDGLQEAKQ